MLYITGVNFLRLFKSYGFVLVTVVVDCIDCAAEASVVNAVNDGINAARTILPIRKPWVMISVNDGEDLHFRKAGILCTLCYGSCALLCVWCLYDI